MIVTAMIVMLLAPAHWQAMAFQSSLSRMPRAAECVAGGASCRALRGATRPISMQRDTPLLKDVVLQPCKTLCKGCVPYICPMAPEGDLDQVQGLSESQKRMLELRKEKELEQERERMEAVAAGVIQVDRREDFEDTVVKDASGRLIIVFWGGAWCRKCTALKPEFVKLTAELMQEYGADAVFAAYCDAKLIAKATDRPPSAILKEIAGVSIVPTIQCWRDGNVLEQYTAGPDRKEVMPAVREMVAAHVSV